MQLESKQQQHDQHEQHVTLKTKWNFRSHSASPCLRRTPEASRRGGGGGRGGGSGGHLRLQTGTGCVPSSCGQIYTQKFGTLRIHPQLEYATDDTVCKL